MRNLTASKKIFLSAAPIAILIVIWEITAQLGLYKISLFPPPSSIIRSFNEMIVNDELFKDIIASLRRVCIGYIVGAGLGICAGGLTGRNQLADYILTPLIQLIRPIPPISFVPLAIVWFGIEESSKYFLVILGSFFPIWISTHLGVSQVSKTYIWAAQSLGAGSRMIFFEVILPAASPLIISGMRTSLGIAFYCLVAAEIAGAFDGVAFRIAISHQNNRTDKMIAGLIILGVLSFLADKIFVFLVNKIFPWYGKSIYA